MGVQITERIAPRKPATVLTVTLVDRSVNRLPRTPNGRFSCRRERSEPRSAETGGSTPRPRALPQAQLHVPRSCHWVEPVGRYVSEAQILVQALCRRHGRKCVEEHSLVPRSARPLDSMLG
jgi:hypothetical protein